MKKINLLFSVALFSMFLMLSCGNDNDVVSIEAPGNVSVQPGFGEAIFTWNFPGDSNAEFIRVDYLDIDGNAKHQKFSRNTATAVIKELDEREYEFTVTASDLNNNRSEPTVVKTTPNKPPYLLVIGTVNAEADLGGITVTWENQAETIIGINIVYVDINGLTQVFKSNSSELNGSTTLSGLTTDEQRFEVYVTNANSVKSPSKFFTLTPLSEVKLDKSNWTILGFSSQETNGEGPVNGFATAAIDDNTGTFWHSQWQGGSPDFPHWFSVDMQEIKKVNKAVLFTRNNDVRGFTKFSLEGSLDGTNWEVLGEYDFDNTVFTGQSYTLGNVYQMRYIKLTALEGPNNFTFLAELDLYGQ